MHIKTKIRSLLINKKTTKPVHIPDYILFNWKKYLAGILSLFFLLIGVIYYLVYNQVELKESKLLLAQELREAKSQSAIAEESLLEKATDSADLKQKLRSIDKKLAKINDFLQARGVKSAFSLSDRINAELASSSTDKASEFYNKHLDVIIHSLSTTPMGFPYPGRITSFFGSRENPFSYRNTERHKGVDIKGNKGAIVKATASGQVKFAGRKGGYGNCVIIKHGNGFETLYGHLSKILVDEGQRIDPGQNIGKIGSTGRSTGPHLHYEVHRNGKVLNPQSFLTVE